MKLSVVKHYLGHPALLILLKFGAISDNILKPMRMYWKTYKLGLWKAGIPEVFLSFAVFATTTIST